jgi:hypothetical protein
VWGGGNHGPPPSRNVQPGTCSASTTRFTSASSPGPDDDGVARPVCDLGKSQVPALGYTVTYAVGNTLLTIWGMVVIMLLS